MSVESMIFCEICLLLTNQFVVDISANIVLDRSSYTGTLSFSEFQVCKELAVKNTALTCENALSVISACCLILSWSSLSF